MGTLLLIPTAREREILLSHVSTPPETVALCGFGPIAAAARAAALIAAHHPQRVILAGIAGTYDPERFPVGSALRAAACSIDGVGAGSGADFLLASRMGFPHWPGDENTPRLDDRIDFDPAGRGLLVTVCAAAGSAAEVEARRARHPGALAEDMEGFGVALACSLAAVPLSILRGASNHCGDRAIKNWRIAEALQAAAATLRDLLAAN